MLKTMFYSIGFVCEYEGEFLHLDFKKVGISTNFYKRLGDYQTWANTSNENLSAIIRVDECFEFETKKEALEFEKQILGSVDIFQAEGFDFPNPTECIPVDVEIERPSNAFWAEDEFGKEDFLEGNVI
jgi:hypothetical protein|tara:strand:+ start:1820 stop:2203 length:384 start_codon:yes stop_codon:yes gene_type:complete